MIVLVLSFKRQEERGGKINISFRFGGDLYLNKASTISYISNFNNGNGDEIEKYKVDSPKRQYN